jgi:hypothetical protein
LGPVFIADLLRLEDETGSICGQRGIAPANSPAPVETHRMTASIAEYSRELFNGGPPARLEALLGVIKRKRLRVLRFAIFVVCAGWLPLILLATLQTLVSHDGSLASFMTDYGIDARSLIAAPLLIMAEAISVPRLSRIGAQFVANGFIAAEDEQAFHNIASSTRRLRDSIDVEIAVVVISIAAGVALAFFVPLNRLPAWHTHGVAGGLRLSAAGWWNDLVTVPILLLLVFGWLWRLVLWARFLFLVSRLRLRLIATHPDHVGGLSFLEISLQTFSLFGFCLAVILAGSMINRVLHESSTIASFRYAIAGFEILMVIAVVGPLLVFTDRLVSTWREGILAYGALARTVGSQMEQKWLPRARAVTDDALQATDFSATTDLYSIVANVYSMKVAPLSIVRLGAFVASTLVPFLPVLLISIPLSFILKKIIGVFL